MSSSENKLNFDLKISDVTIREFFHKVFGTIIDTTHFSLTDEMLDLTFYDLDDQTFEAFVNETYSLYHVPDNQTNVNKFLLECFMAMFSSTRNTDDDFIENEDEEYESEEEDEYDDSHLEPEEDELTSDEMEDDLTSSDVDE